MNLSCDGSSSDGTIRVAESAPPPTPLTSTEPTSAAPNEAVNIDQSTTAESNAVDGSPLSADFTKADQEKSGAAGAAAASSSAPAPVSGASDTNETANNGGKVYTLGVCAMECKSRSKPMRYILSAIVASGHFNAEIFTEKMILEEPVTDWPVCHFLISFHSKGFPLDKAIAYAALRRPFVVNDLSFQKLLLDRRPVLAVLSAMGVPCLQRVILNRPPPVPPSDDSSTMRLLRRALFSLSPHCAGVSVFQPSTNVRMVSPDILSVDGVEIEKPFVEKPVDADDHNIYVYFHSSQGGGCRKLFRKIDNKSSEFFPDISDVRNDGRSYIYEKYVAVDRCEDVKVYTVGPNYAYAETRKSPVVDGIVNRNHEGKELRFETRLTQAEIEFAHLITTTFRQAVCGFDILRTQGRSYVIDVNGWSFVKGNKAYYKRCAELLTCMFLKTAKKSNSPQFHALTSSEALPPCLSLEAPYKNLVTPPGTPTSLHRRQCTCQTDPGQYCAVHANLRTSPVTLCTNDHTKLLNSSLSSFTLEKQHSTESFDSMKISKMASHYHKSNNESKQSQGNQQSWRLKGFFCVLRHADRTPKLKQKFNISVKHFSALFEHGEREKAFRTHSEIAAVIQFARQAIQEYRETTDLSSESLEVPPEIEHTIRLLALLESKGEPGVAPPKKVQIKASTAKQGDPATANQRFSKIQAVVKWGGAFTHAGVHQAIDLAENLRKDLELLNRQIVNNIQVFSAAEPRVLNTATVFLNFFCADAPPGVLAKATVLPSVPDQSPQICLRPDLLDDAWAAKPSMEKVKAGLAAASGNGGNGRCNTTNGASHESTKPPALKPINTTLLPKSVEVLSALASAAPKSGWLEETPTNLPEPKCAKEKVPKNASSSNGGSPPNPIDQQKSNEGGIPNIELAPEMQESIDSLQEDVPIMHEILSRNYKALSDNGYESIQNKWCCGDSPVTFFVRWDRMLRAFGQPRGSRPLDLSRIPEAHDSLKYDLLHNRNFLIAMFSEDNFVTEKSQQKQSPIDNNLDQTGITAAPVANMETTGYNAFGSDRSPSPGPPDASATKHVPERVRRFYKHVSLLFSVVGPGEYGTLPAEQHAIGIATSGALLAHLVDQIVETSESNKPRVQFYFTKERHVQTLLNLVYLSKLPTRHLREEVGELDYLTQIVFEIYERKKHRQSAPSAASSVSSDTSGSSNESESNFSRLSSATTSNASNSSGTWSEQGAESAAKELSFRVSVSPGARCTHLPDVDVAEHHVLSTLPRHTLTEHTRLPVALDAFRSLLECAPKEYVQNAPTKQNTAQASTPIPPPQPVARVDE